MKKKDRLPSPDAKLRFARDRIKSDRKFHKRRIEASPPPSWDDAVKILEEKG